MTLSEIVELASPNLRVRVAPSMGGRITSLVEQATGTEWLYPGVASGPIRSGMTFAEGTRGGFDECLPSVAACIAGDVGWPDGTVGDHGDFWWRPWEILHVSEQRLELSAAFSGYPLTLVRSLELSATAPLLLLDYQLTNHSEEPLQYLYSAHPLLALSSSMIVDLPTGLAVITAFGGPLEAGVSSEWPWAQGKAGLLRIDRIEAEGPPTNYKVFVGSTGSVALRDAATGRGLMFRFDPELLPWLGVCVNRRGWPEAGSSDTWVAIEPTTAPTDDLTHAVKGGWAREIAPGDTHSWTLELMLREGAADLESGGRSHE